MGHAAHGKKGNPYRVFVERPKEKRCLEDIDTDGMMTLKQILGIGEEGTDWINHFIFITRYLNSETFSNYLVNITGIELYVFIA